MNREQLLEKIYDLHSKLVNERNGLLVDREKLEGILATMDIKTLKMACRFFEALLESTLGQDGSK